MERKLTAILCADVYGYSRLMGEDEEGTLRTLSAYRKITDCLIERHHGRFVNSAGDSILAEFASVVEAVTCAVSIQTALRPENAELPPERRMQFRIGVNLGDVMVEGEQIYGDGVNVAARLETLADPGGICISDIVHGQVRTKVALRYQDLGEQHVKNIAEPIRVLRVLMDGTLPAENPQRINGTKHHMLLSAIGIGAVLLAAIIYGLVKWKGWSSAPVARPASANPQMIRSIAVLPLDNFSGDPNQEYFADGMTDELTTDLASISALRVISRTSVMQYQGKHRPPAPEIAKALNVEGLVEGTVLRIGDRVRITAQLIDAPADKHLWAKTFERTSRDVLALQDELAAAIAHEINARLTSQEQALLTNARPVNPEAYDAYLQGRYFLNRLDWKKALPQFQRSIQLDSGFAPAFAGLSVAYTGSAWVNEVDASSPQVMSSKGKAAAETALQLDNTSAEAHAALGIALENFFDFTGAERELRAAIALNPNYAYAHDQYGIMLAQLGRLDQALAENMRAAELDPFSPEVHVGWAWTLIWQGNYEAATEQNRKVLELDPEFAEWNIGWTDIQAGKFRDSIPSLQKAYAIYPKGLATAGYLGYAYAASGDSARAIAIIADLRQQSSRRFVSPLWPAIIYLGLGDRQRSLEGLEKAYELHDPNLMNLKMDRVYNSIRSDPRFTDLLRKVGFDK